MKSYSSRAGKARVDDAVRWIKANKRDFLALQELCLRVEALRDRDGRPVYGSIMRGSVYLQAEQIGMDIGDASIFHRDNNLWSTISRYMTRFHPQLERVIRHREQSDVGTYVALHGLPRLHYSYRYGRRKAA